MSPIEQSPEARDRLSKFFCGSEAILQAKLTAVRATLTHGGSKGSSVEEAVRDFIRGILPRKYEVTAGEIIDISGRRSGQVDVVVDNEFQIPMASIGLHTVEGVSACGEVKTRLTTGELDDILMKGLKLRQLRNVQSGQNMTFGTAADRQRFHQSPPYFGIALETNVAPTTVLDRLHQASDVERQGVSVPSLPALDALFVLGDGVYINYRAGGHTFSGSDSNGEYQGWRYKSAEDSGVLTTMFAWLHGAMPQGLRFVPGAGAYLFPVTAADSWSF